MGTHISIVNTLKNKTLSGMMGLEHVSLNPSAPCDSRYDPLLVSEAHYESLFLTTGSVLQQHVVVASP